MEIKKAWLVAVDGIKRLPELEGKEMDFQTMYPIIDCTTIEHVGLKKGVDMWCDEEGLLKNDFVVNQMASVFYRKAYPHIDPEQLGIVGRAIITDNTKEGNFII